MKAYALVKEVKDLTILNPFVKIKKKKVAIFISFQHFYVLILFALLIELGLVNMVRVNNKNQ